MHRNKVSRNLPFMQKANEFWQHHRIVLIVFTIVQTSLGECSGSLDSMWSMFQNGPARAFQFATKGYCIKGKKRHLMTI